jgi:protein TonB
MFEDSTFESMGVIHTRTRGWMMATFALNGTILLALILLPLFYPQMLPSMVRLISMEAPPPPLEPVQVQPARSPLAAQPGSAPALQANPVIPTMNPYPRTPDDGQIDSTPIDVRNLSGSENPLAATGGPFRGGSHVQVIQQKPRAPASVSQGVMNGMLVFKPAPLYPPIALATRTGGTVILEAIISKSGAIENLRVVSGPGLLRQAALDAVRRWRYRPYLLDGQPVEVETTVNVVFTLN